MDQIKTIVNIPGWPDAFEGFGNSATGLYMRVPLVYRCVRLKADALSSVKLKFYRGVGETRQEVEAPWLLDWQEWTWRTAAALMICGASYSIKLTNGLRPRGLQWLNPTSVSPIAEFTEEGLSVRFVRTGNAIGGKVAMWPADQMLYIREFNPVDDILPGPSNVDVAARDGGLLHYLTTFASYYFEHGAMPLTILSVDRNVREEEIKRVQNLFQQIGTGIRNAWRVVALRGGKENTPFTLTPPLKDLVMPELNIQARQAVAGAFGIPITMLEDAANFATAAEHTTQFWTTCIRPMAVKIAGALNEQVLAPMGMSCEYAFEDLDVFQEDEAQRAASLNQLTTAGIPLIMAMEILGYDLDEDDRAKLEAALAEKERKAEEIAQSMNNAQANRPQDPQQDKPQDKPTEQQPQNDRQAQRSALHNWKAASLAAVKTGHSASVDFDHPAIPESVADALRYELAGCKTAEDVQAAFKAAREWLSDKPVDIGAEIAKTNALLARFVELADAKPAE